MLSVLSPRFLQGDSLLHPLVMELIAASDLLTTEQQTVCQSNMLFVCMRRHFNKETTQKQNGAANEVVSNHLQKLSLNLTELHKNPEYCAKKHRGGVPSRGNEAFAHCVYLITLARLNFSFKKCQEHKNISLFPGVEIINFQTGPRWI